jgi:hypothetical protein
MNTLSRWIVLSAGALVGLAIAAGSAAAQPVYVSYYNAPVVTYYARPVAYYTPVTPVAVSTTRYGLFGLRRSTTVAYGPTVPVVSSYYAPPVVSSYYATPVVSSYYAAPVVSSYYAPPVVSSYYAAPVVSSYYAAPVVSSYYAPPVIVTYR